MTGEVLAAIYNTVRDSKRRPKPFSGTDFDPYAPPPRQQGIEAFAALAGVPMSKALKLSKEAVYDA